jgi:hypothetical protein
MSHIEVDEESETDVRKTEVGEELGKVDWQNLLNRLNFHDHNFCNEKIDPVSGIHSKSVIDDGKEDLRLNVHARFRKLVLETGLVNVFQETRSES